VNTIPVKSVSDSEFAFGAVNFQQLLPPVDAVPEEFSDSSNPWTRLSTHVLAEGISTDHHFVHHEGVDSHQALRHIGAVLQSACDDGRKIPAVAYLLSRWFSYARVNNVMAAAAN